MSYNSGWVGRYYALDNTLVGISMLPGLSYRLNEKLSIGAAANVMIGYLNHSNAINNRAFLNVPDGDMRVTDTTVGAEEMSDCSLNLKRARDSALPIIPR